MQTAPSPTPSPVPRSRRIQGVLTGLSFRPAPPTITIQVEGQNITISANADLVEYALRFRGKLVQVAILITDSERALSVRPPGEIPPEERDADHLERHAEVLMLLA